MPLAIITDCPSSLRIKSMRPLRRLYANKTSKHILILYHFRVIFSSLQFSILQVGFSEISTSQVCFAEEGFSEISFAEEGFSEISFAEEGATKVGFSEEGATEVGFEE